MARDEEDVRVRLQRAALELFRERCYERTTAAEIAASAGVTERTFFRQFTDKREVLFGGEAMLRTAMTAAIAEAPAEMKLLDVLEQAFRSVLPALEEHRPFSEPWHEVISATPALRERELAKTAALVDSLAAALKARGVADLPAVLAAQAGMVAFRYATIAWLEHPGPSLSERLDASMRELKALSA